MYPFVLPSGLPVSLREMTGAEEELLTNPKLVRKGVAINQVLHNCLVSLGENEAPTIQDVLDLLSGDRLALLLELRRISLGDEVALELTCIDPDCRHINHATWNLGDFHATPYTEERSFTVTLPGSKRVARFVHMDGHMEQRLAALKDATPTAAMLMRITDIDGSPPSKKLMREMSLRDRNALRHEMQVVDAGVDTTLHLECAECGTRLITRLEAEPGFLFPGVRF